MGDGNNVCNSLVIGCVKLNIPILVATPEKYRPHQDIIDWVEKEKKSQFFKIYTNPKEAIKEADIVYTDTFVSMGQEEETENRLKIFLPKFQVNSELLSYATKSPLIMHCLPAHRGIEITNEILDSENSIVFHQAENRIHIQKALMLKLLKKNVWFRTYSLTSQTDLRVTS